MGHSYSRDPSRDALPTPPDHQVMDVYEPTSSPVRRGRKRKNATPASESKKVARLNTCAYVYQKLFVQGEDSDITIVACGREWKVHKLYLKQTKFFETMFDGEWADSKCGKLEMAITDPHIDADGLHAVLGSLYHNEIEIDLENIEATVAAASYIVLESVIDRCAEMMIEALSTSNVVRYLELSTTYGLDTVRIKAMQFLLHGFWKIMADFERLRDINRKLLKTLLTSPDLMITEGEFDLYKTLKHWIYMQECPECVFDDQFKQNSSNFYKQAEPYSMFMKYSDLFSCIRLEHLLNSSETMRIVKTDRQIPSQIVDAMTSSLWESLIHNEEIARDVEITDDDFYKRCYRLGRSLDSYPKCWRWIGFNLGVDILLHVNDYSVSIKRNCMNQKVPYSVNLRSKQVMHYRLVICDSSGAVVHDTGKHVWDMKPDEARTICRLTDDLSTPISVHFQYLIHKPVKGTDQYVEELLEELSSKTEA